MADGVESRELEELRDQVIRYEEFVRGAGPRLAAFQRLEELARSGATTPEAVAAAAANDLLRREREQLETECRQLRDHGGQLKGELAMLLQNRDQAAAEVNEFQVEYEGLQSEVVEILDELQMLRGDAARLMAQRRQLETEIARLRREMEGMADRRAAAAADREPEVATGAPRRKTTGFDLDEDEQERRFADFFSDSVEHDKARDWILG